MPRTFSTAVQGEINKQFAGEPMVLVEVEWARGTGVFYADRKLNGEEYPYPYVVDISQFDTTTIVSGGTDSQEVTVTMNDIDGTMRSIIDTHDIHLNPVRLYLTFQGLPITEKALLFEGVINSPIVWDEGGRTLSFSVLNQIESVEAGFAMEDGDFPFIEPSDRNKPWPLVFGEICNMEAVTVRATRKGFLAEGQGVMDPTIEERLCQAYKLKCPTATTKTTSAPDPTNPLDPNQGATNVRNNKPDPQCVQRRFNKICEILTERAQQQQYVQDTLTIRGGQEFPQNTPITIQIGEVRYEGHMNGETFTITQTFHPDEENIDNPPCMDVPDAGWGYRYGPDPDNPPTTVEGCENGGSNFDKDVRDGSGESWRYFNEFERGSFIWLPPGAEVVLADESEIINIVSLIPGTVTQVAAYRNFADTSLLMAVDPSRYTVVNSDFGGYNIVEVRLDSPLSTIPEEDWDDEIYVSFVSDIGPNPVDTIEWLITKYTDLSVDPTSFNSVRSSLENYPSNFFVKARPRVLDLVRDVAYQSRCAVFVRDGIVYITYLSAEPTSVKTLTESDILPNSFKINHTTTEDLETRHTISWREGEAGVYSTDETEFELVLKHNVPKYGIFDSAYNYYTMNIFELVEKSATFWMIRKSNTWKLVEFETPLVHLNLDVFDAVTINLQQFSSKVVITEARFNLDTNTISFKAWTPIRAGENSEYLWAWPAAKPALAIHPLTDDTSELGDGSTFSVVPPEGHPLRGAYDPEVAVYNTAGDRYPSDIGDEFPEVVCKIATGVEISDEIEPEFDPFEPLAEENFADELDDIEAGVQDSNSLDDSEDQTACGDPGPANGGCVYEVSVLYTTPAAVTGNCSAGPCNGSFGQSCFGSLHRFCHAFGALFSATAFASAKQAEIDALKAGCGRYQPGKTDPYQVSSINGIEGSGPFGECEEVPDPNHPAAGAGQIRKPGLASGDPSTAPDTGDL